MVTIQLHTTANDVSRALRHLAYRELPFAMAKAVNATAVDVRDDQRGLVRRVFEVRSHRVPQAVRIQWAKKSRKPFAAVGVLNRADAFLAPHALGGDKRPAPGRRYVSIPSKLVERMRGAGGRIPTGKKPKALLTRKTKRGNLRGGFFVKDDGPNVSIEQRVDKAKGSRARLARLGTATWYLLRARVRINKRWPFEASTRATVQRTYDRHFQRWLLIAANTTKTKVRPSREMQGPMPFVGPLLRG